MTYHFELLHDIEYVENIMAGCADTYIIIYTQPHPRTQTGTNNNPHIAVVFKTPNINETLKWFTYMFARRTSINATWF